MDIRMMDSSEIPLPPKEVRLVSVVADPYPDGLRLKLRIQVTPFQERPNFEVRITNPLGQEVGSLSIIESVEPTIELTTHLRGEVVPGVYVVRTRLVYSDLDLSSEMSTKFALGPR
jgi:hypothetical protein